MSHILRRLLSASILLALGWQASPAKVGAQTPAVQLGRPVVARPATPAVVLERPVVPAARVDPAVQQTAARSVVRGQSSEEPPLQLGPPRKVEPLPGNDEGIPAYAPYAPSGPFPMVPSPLFAGGAPEDAFASGDGVNSIFNNRLYFGADYILWWIRGSRFPTLVTTSSLNNPNATPPPGTLGQPTTFPVWGAGQGRMEQSGGRLRSGYWFDDSHCCGLESSVFFLGERSTRASIASNGSQTLALPFSVNGVQSALPIAFNFNGNVRAGMVQASVGTEVWGGEVNLRKNLIWGPGGHLDVVAGYRYLGLDDDFRFLVGSGSLTTMDWLSTQNRFNGGQIGLVGEIRRGVFFSEWSVKVALGGTNQEVTSSGGSSAGTSGVLFGQTRSQERSQFAVLPELGVNLGIQLTNHARIYAGYNFLFLSSVARPGEQINTEATSINQPIQSTNFWAHGVNFGLEFKW